MKAVDIQDGASAELSPEKILAQLELMTQDEVFRSSKRSIAFLKYVVTEALNGAGDQIKERTIGIEVFGRSSSYDTNLDHIVRTAATELRKRLAIYYGDERHRAELRIGLIPGSYVPKFTQSHPLVEAETVPAPPPFVVSKHLPVREPGTYPEAVEEHVAVVPAAEKRVRWRWVALACVGLLLAGLLIYRWQQKPDVQTLFWKPVVDTPGAVLIAVGDVPNGPPMLPDAAGSGMVSTPIPSAGPAQTVPFADAVTIARVMGTLVGYQKKALIRRESSSSFSDLRQGAVVLIGAFNNGWSLRLTHPLRYSLALDPEQHLIYIKDAKNPLARNWSWGTNQPRNPGSGINSPKLHDYALISRIQSSETGHVVVVIGGLYTYGTEAAGEFLTDPNLMQAIASRARRIGSQGTLQIVLGTTVTDQTPGPPSILAISTE